VPLHPDPLHPRNTLPLVAICDKITLVLSAYGTTHAPLLAMLFSVHDTPAGVLVTVPPVIEPPLAATVNTGGAMNCAVILRVTPVTADVTHVVPRHAPLYPENDESPDGVAESVIVVPAANVFVHVPLGIPITIVQLMPLGTLDTVPWPVPPPVTLTVCVAKVASTVRGDVIATVQGVSVQSPLHAWNDACPLADWLRVTTADAGQRALHVPLVTVPITTQLMPAGVLVIVPPPPEPSPAPIVKRCAAATNCAVTADVAPLTTVIVHAAPVHAPE
jgi:hypothetical protein